MKPSFHRPPVRRVVTGHNDAGRSVISIDAPAPLTWDSAHVPGLGSCVAWMTEPGVVNIVSQRDAASADAVVPMVPPTLGTIFRVADFPPDSLYTPEAREAMFGDIGGEHARRDGVENGDARHFWFHRTHSLDYAVVLEGEIVMLMDEGETTLYPGDVIIQRATNHAWSNRTDSVCRMLFVLMGSEEVSPADRATVSASSTAQP